MSQELPDGVELAKRVASAFSDAKHKGSVEWSLHEMATKFLADREKQAARVPVVAWMRQCNAGGHDFHVGDDPELVWASTGRVWQPLCLAAPTTEPSKAEQADVPSDALRIACITLDGTTLYIPAKCITDFGIGDDDGETYTLTFKTMTRAEFDALGEFDGF